MSMLEKVLEDERIFREKLAADRAEAEKEKAEHDKAFKEKWARRNAFMDQIYQLEKLIKDLKHENQDAIEDILDKLDILKEVEYSIQ